MGAVKMHDLIRRQRAAEATLAKYRSKPFNWSKGVTCVHLAWFHLRQMGHTPPPLPRIRSALAAKRELKARGWDTVSQVMDTILPRITPARMMPGDLAALPTAEGGLGAIFMCAGHKFFGWREDVEGLVMLSEVDLTVLDGVWRV